MGHESRIKLIDFIHLNPGLNSGEIARRMGFSGWLDINGDFQFLRKYKIVRREGRGRDSKWYLIEGARLPEPRQSGPRKGFIRYPRLCGYHNEKGPSNTICARCSEASEAPRITEEKARKKAQAKLQKMFPKIFSSNGGKK